MKVKDNKNLWMRKLKNKLQDYSEPVPKSTWDNVEKKLMSSKGNHISFVRGCKWVAMAAVLLVAVSSFGLYLLNSTAKIETGFSTADDKLISDVVVHHSPDISSPDISSSDKQKSSDLFVPKIQVRAHVNGKIAQGMKQESLKTVQQSASSQRSDLSQVVSTDTVDARASSANRENKTSIKSAKPKSHSSGKKEFLSSDEAMYRSYVASARTHHRSWSMGIYVGGGGISTTAGGSDIPDLSYLDASASVAQMNNTNLLQIVDDTPSEMEKDADMDYHQPITVGFSICKTLSPTFSIESGLNYTLLSSDANVGIRTQFKQLLHYVGIPVLLRMNLYNTKSTMLYLSTGGAVEKCVYGTYGHEKLTVKPLQFSVSGALGAQINISKKIGVYIEPGVAYYFDNGSPVQTIRKDTPLNFNLRAGIRFTYGSH